MNTAPSGEQTNTIRKLSIYAAVKTAPCEEALS